jgi:hypothetical protein
MEFTAHLQQIATVLLEEDVSVWQKARQTWQNDPEAFVEEGLADRYQVEELLDEGPDDKESQISLFLGVALDLGYSLYVDWSGEESEGDFETWVDARLHAFGQAFDYMVIEDWLDQVDEDRLERGDYILQKFALVGKAVAEQDFTLIFFQEGGDTYFPFLLRSADWEKMPAAVRSASDDEDPYPYLCSYAELPSS